LGGAGRVQSMRCARRAKLLSGTGLSGQVSQSGSGADDAFELGSRKCRSRKLRANSMAGPDRTA
jgi:hypothetical protein